MNVNELIDLIKNKNTLKKLTSEESKTKLLNYINDTILPAAKELSSLYIAKLIEQSKTKVGLLLFRDAYLIPVFIKLAFFLLESSTKLMLNKTNAD